MHQLLLTWQDHITFVLKDDFKICTIKYMEIVVDTIGNMTESAEEKFAANFIIMTEILSQFLNDLLTIFAKKARKT